MMDQLLLLLLLSTLLAPSQSLSSTTPSTTSCPENSFNVNVQQLQEDIAHGRVHQVHDFLTEDDVVLLLNEMDELEFTRSGLSNTVKGSEQGFGTTDRYLSVVPWWHRVISGEEPQLPPHITKLRHLLAVLATSLQRPTLVDQTHECYYSKSLPNSTLDRHMDERHEELKGRLGWLEPSRRSISWLIYLSDEGWDIEDHGGALRAMKAPGVPSGEPSTHEGNLQIGWWTRQGGKDQQESSSLISKPVYLNSWLPFSPTEDEPPYPHCIMYIVNEKDEIQYVSHPWPNDATGMSTSDFILQHQSDLIPEHSSAFSLLEDRRAWQTSCQFMELTPTRRSLVLFDSVVVPHEVGLIHKGTRRALAGWFHEATQPIPEQWMM